MTKSTSCTVLQWITPFVSFSMFHTNKGKTKTPTVHSLYASGCRTSPAFPTFLYDECIAPEYKRIPLAETLSQEVKRVSESYANGGILAQCARHAEQHGGFLTNRRAVCR